MSKITSLPGDLESFGFVTREKVNGRTIINKCGRDFLYYALNYYKPDIFNPSKYNPIQIDKEHLFGIPMPAMFAWTQLQFIYIPQLLRKYNLELSINGKKITNFLEFLLAIMIPSFQSIDKVLQKVIDNVDGKIVTGIDISIGIGGLLDHVLFVYGYDDGYLYVIDTHQLEKLEYKKIGSGNNYLMKLSKDIVRKRWGPFGRVWSIQNPLADHV
jgi:ABC-type glycerol-3-phosphate transport system substrate-binding protein|tara:strand:+ start:16083 stop:16724 length:642 start_codon:yes stop_codon:yes gene_type:complete